MTAGYCLSPVPSRRRDGLWRAVRHDTGGMDISLRLLNRYAGWLEILIHLYFDGRTGKVQLSKSVRSSFETINKTVTLLSELGLVHVFQEARFPFRNTCELTELGRKLVKTPICEWPAVLWQVQSVP